MSLVIRPAGEADLDALARLNDAVQSLHVTLYPTDFRAAVDKASVGDFFAARLATTIVAEADRTLIGYAWFEFQHVPETPFTSARLRLYVHHLAVAPGARRQGVATGLLAHVERRAAAEGVDDIALDCWADNLLARKFFAARGFGVFNLRLRKQISAAASSRPAALEDLD